MYETKEKKTPNVYDAASELYNELLDIFWWIQWFIGC